MLTGVTAHETGMLGLAHRGFKLDHPDRHLASWLGAAGYHTALSGIQHEFGPGRKLPYAEVLEAPGHGADSAGDAASGRTRGASSAIPARPATMISATPTRSTRKAGDANEQWFDSMG